MSQQSASRTAFCVRCGHGLVPRLLDGDMRERLFCPNCRYVHYENPRVLVACLATSGGRVLLCRRAIDPAYGLWAPPAGYVEIGESLECAAVREVWEEAGVRIRVRDLALRGVTSLITLEQVYVHFRACAESTACQAGPESLDAAFFDPRDIPWNRLAFPSIAKDLMRFLDEGDAKRWSIRISCER